MNLLLAAAIAGAPTPGQEGKGEDSEDEKDKEEVALEKVLEMWKAFQKSKDGKISASLIHQSPFIPFPSLSLPSFFFPFLPFSPLPFPSLAISPHLLSSLVFSPFPFPSFSFP